MTGHDDGLITINIAEADSAERERRRVELGEPYRTLLGHLRHEVGHYYWDVLVRDGGRIEAARAVFGDESVDYQEALERHYQNGAPADWQESYVSAYATMHPWEDFAETWTHYLHMVDTLDTAASFGLAVDPGGQRRSDAQDRDRLRSLPRRELRPAGRRLAAADRRGQQPEPQHGPAGPLSVRADARRRSRSCASSTTWCGPAPNDRSRVGTIVYLLILHKLRDSGRFARPGGLCEMLREPCPRSASPPISAATARRPPPRPRAPPCARCWTASSPTIRCCAPTSWTTRAGCAATSTSSSAAGRSPTAGR